MALIAGSAGFFGGVAHEWTRQHSPVRASRFEMVDRSGDVVSTWSVDSSSDVAFRFRTKGLQSAEIGLTPSGESFLRMYGRDGKNRIAFGLGLFDKPYLDMSDEKWQGRVRLGFIAPDSVPYGDWDDWGLMFSSFGSERPVSGIGVMKNWSKGGRTEGFLISGK